MDFLSKIHPVLVHFPIVLFVLYSLSEIAALFYKEKNFNKVVTVLLALALFFAVGAVLTGNRAAEISKGLLTSVQSEILETHETLATLSLFYYAALFFIKFYLLTKKKFEGIIKYVFLAIVLIGNIFIYLTGYYGGRLVFEYGIGTAIFR